MRSDIKVMDGKWIPPIKGYHPDVDADASSGEGTHVDNDNVPQSQAPAASSAAQDAFFQDVPLVTAMLRHVARTEVIRLLQVSRTFNSAGLPIVYRCVHARDLDKVNDGLRERYVRTAVIPMGFGREMRFRDMLVPRSTVIKAVVDGCWEPDPRWCPALHRELQAHGPHGRPQDASKSTTPVSLPTSPCADPWFHMCTRYFSSTFAVAHYLDPVWACTASTRKFYTVILYGLPWPGFWAVEDIDSTVCVVFDLIQAVVGCTERIINVVGIGETDPFWEQRLWPHRHERQSRAEANFTWLLDTYLTNWLRAPTPSGGLDHGPASPLEWLRARIKARIRFVSFKAYLESGLLRGEFAESVVGNWLNQYYDLEDKEREDKKAGADDRDPA